MFPEQQKRKYKNLLVPKIVVELKSSFHFHFNLGQASMNFTKLPHYEISEWVHSSFYNRYTCFSYFHYICTEFDTDYLTLKIRVRGID